MKTEEEIKLFSDKTKEIAQKHVIFVQSIGLNPTQDQLEAIKRSEEETIEEMKNHLFSYIGYNSSK